MQRLSNPVANTERLSRVLETYSLQCTYVNTRLKKFVRLDISFLCRFSVACLTCKARRK